MSLTIYKKPSLAMLESYNEKIRASTTTPPFDLVSWTVKNNTTTGPVTVDAMVSWGNVFSTKIHRYALSDLLVPNTDGYAVIDATEFENTVAQNYVGGFAEIKQRMNVATRLNYVGDITKDDKVDEFLAKVWTMKKVFIPSTEVVITDIKSDPYITEFNTQSGITVVDAYNIEAKPNSLGFTGSVKVIVSEPLEENSLMGPAASYPGTGWYKATDTGIVFSKDVLDGETFQFTANGPEYIAVSNNNKNIIRDEPQLYYSTSNVTDFYNFFYYFDSEVEMSHWDVSNVTTMGQMFYEAQMNPDMSNWDVSNVTEMTSMFYRNMVINTDISKWDVSKVTNMQSMFTYANAFNQNIGSWDVSNVTATANMFAYTNAFNQDISGWNVSSVDGFDSMFESALAFNQDLSNWCVTNITEEPYNFAVDAAAWVLPKPVWGTCPRGENTGT